MDKELRRRTANEIRINAKCVHFTNEHGEKFTVYRYPKRPEKFFFEGDETDNEILPLFGNFIFSKEEVAEVVKSITELTKEEE